MSTATVGRGNPGPLRVVLDTNVIVSAVAYGGVPANVVYLVVRGDVIGVTSNILIAETLEILTKKIGFSRQRADAIRRKVRWNFRVVHPSRKLAVLRDDADNRVLEAAIAGQCSYIVTGDKELLNLSAYRAIRIVTPRQFIDLVSRF